MYPTANEKIIISRRVPCRLQTRRIKVPQFVFHHAASNRPGGELLYRSRLRHRVRPCRRSVSDARYSWQVDGMDCAACARKVETAVRQVPGVSQVRAVRHRKLLVNAEGDVRAQVENAVRRVYAARCRCSRSRANPRSLLRDNLPLLTLVIMMALSWGWSRPTTLPVSWPLLPPPGLWPVARRAAPDQERELVRH